MKSNSLTHGVRENLRVDHLDEFLYEPALNAPEPSFG